MGTYNLPRNVKGEGRILFIFSRKGLMYTAAAAMIGFVFYLILSMIGLKTAGMVVIVVFALIGFSIGTFKVPNISGIKWAKVNAGENLDDVIKRAILFKQKRNKIYIYKEGKTDDK